LIFESPIRLLFKFSGFAKISVTCVASNFVSSVNLNINGMKIAFHNNTYTVSVKDMNLVLLVIKQYANKLLPT